MGFSSCRRGDRQEDTEAVGEQSQTLNLFSGDLDLTPVGAQLREHLCTAPTLTCHL